MGSDVPEQAPLPSGISMLVERERDARPPRARGPTPHDGDEERGAHRLRALAVRVRGEQHVLLARGALREGSERACASSRDERGALVAHVEAQVERDLVVARARRVQARRDRADALAELRLDGHVHVFFVLPAEPACPRGASS